MEIWKSVVGYEGFYEASNLGNIKSLYTGKIRKPVFNKRNGYFMIFLCKPKERHCEYVHRIVANAFCNKPDGMQFVNHIDENKLNDNASNLEWCTKAYNNSYNGKNQRCCKPIDQLDFSGKLIKAWNGAREIYNSLGIEYKNISACCRELRKSAGGFIWRFSNE